MVSKKKKFNSNLKLEIQKLEKKSHKKYHKKTHKKDYKKIYNKLDGGGLFSSIKGYAQLGVAKGKYGIDSTKLSVEKLKIASTASKKGFLVGRNGTIEIETLVSNRISRILERNAGVFPLNEETIYSWIQETKDAIVSADILAAGWYAPLAADEFKLYYW